MMAASAVPGVVRHTVMLKVGNKADKEKVATKLRELTGGVPGVKMLKFEVFTDIGISDGNADVAVVADFPDAENYLKYAAHPAHLSVINDNKPFVVGRTAIQYNIAKI